MRPGPITATRLCLFVSEHFLAMLKQVRQNLLLKKLDANALDDLVAELDVHDLSPRHIRVLKEESLSDALYVLHAPHTRCNITNEVAEEHEAGLARRL